jgi:hypothetical protein
MLQCCIQVDGIKEAERITDDNHGAQIHVAQINGAQIYGAQASVQAAISCSAVAIDVRLLSFRRCPGEAG